MFDKINVNEIKKIKLIFENCESVTLPIESFGKLKLDLVDNCVEMECRINDIETIDFSRLHNYESPISRIYKHNDITAIVLHYHNEKSIRLNTVWYFEDKFSCEVVNDYQKSKLINYRQLDLSIKKENKTYTIFDIFRLEEDTKIIDSKNNVYTISEDEDGKYLEDIIVDNKIINETFRLYVNK